MDSIAIAYWKRPHQAFTVDYGQLAARAEIEAARAVALDLGIEHYVIEIDTRALGSGDMAGEPPDANAPASDWWPYRNQLLVTVAAMRGISLGVTELMLGAVATDAQHRDGTATFVKRLDALMKCQEGEIRVTAPAIALRTVDLIRQVHVPRSLMAWAHSCHSGNLPCGRCRGCSKYLEIMHELVNAGDWTE
jgi:7-cyano-7-deazaguanine synthase